MNSHNFAKLPPDLIELLSRYLLSDDVVDYINFRAVCSDWRSHTASPYSFATCFRPRRWIMLSDKDAEASAPRHFFNISTGRSLLIAIPELKTHSIVFCCDGLLVLLDMKRHGIMRLFNPFTCQLSADYPPFCTSLQYKDYLTQVRKYKCLITDEVCPTLIVYHPWTDQHYSKPGYNNWQHICLKDQLKHISSILFFRGKFYCISIPHGAICLLDTERNLVIPLIEFVNSTSFDIFGPYLVESDSGLLIVRPIGGLVTQKFQIFQIKLGSKTLTKFENLGHQALFINYNDQTFWVSLKVPSIKSNCINYKSDADGMVDIYSLHDRSGEFVRTINLPKSIEFQLPKEPLSLGDHIEDQLSVHSAFCLCI